MTRKYKVTLFNLDAKCGIEATGTSRIIAFNNAMRRAGEPFLTYGGDKATSLRVAFHDELMKKYRMSPWGRSQTQNRCYVEFRKVSE